MYALNPKLRKFWRSPARYKVLHGGRASSKCLALGTMVMMADGSLRAVEAIRVGEQVMGPDSLPRNVLHTTRGESDMYRVRQSSGMDYVVNEDHILSVRRVESSRKGKMLASGEWSPRYPHLGDVHNINVKEYAAASAKFRVNFVGYRAGLIDLPSRPLELDPYIMGAWLGDGDSDGAIFTTMDREIVDELEAFAADNDMEVRTVADDERSRARRYRVCEKDRYIPGQKNAKKNRILTALKGYGIANTYSCKGRVRTLNKSVKRIPEDYLLNDEAARLELLAGLMDTDGNYHSARRSMVIGLANEMLARDVKRLVDGLGFKTSIHKRKTTAQNGFVGSAWIVTFSGSLDRVPCRIARKKALPDKCNAKNHLLTYIEVIPEGRGEYAGFSVDGDNLFCLADGTVTHNSHDAAGFAVFLAANYRLKIMCARQFQNRISESVYTLIQNKIEESEFKNEFIFTKTSIKHKTTGSEFLFYGIARNLNEIKSTEGIDILWLEEANYLTKEQWKVIDPTIRKKGAQIWLIFNPDDYMDFVYQQFVVKKQFSCVTQEINWPDNPFLDQSMIDLIKHEYEVDPKGAEHTYGGKPKMGQDKSVINLLYILASIDAHLKVPALDAHKPEAERRVWPRNGRKVIGFDVADDGDDKCATVEAHGNILVGAEEWEGLEDQLLKSSTRVFNRALETGSDVVFDSIGVGANVGSKFSELNEARGTAVVYEAFNAGGAVMKPDEVFKKFPHMNILNKDHFSNIKAQKWTDVAEQFRKTYEVVTQGAMHPIDELISIDSSTFDAKLLDQLKQELSSPKKDVDGNGRFKVESKADLRKRGIESPNIADAVIMARIIPKRKSKGFFD